MTGAVGDARSSLAAPTARCAVLVITARPTDPTGGAVGAERWRRSACGRRALRPTSASTVTSSRSPPVAPAAGTGRVRLLRRAPRRVRRAFPELGRSVRTAAETAHRRRDGPRGRCAKRVTPRRCAGEGSAGAVGPSVVSSRRPGRERRAVVTAPVLCRWRRTSARCADGRTSVTSAVAATTARSPDAPAR